MRISENLGMKILFVLLLLSQTVNSQNFTIELNKIKSNNQQCLNKGKHMYSCAMEYYQKSDSLLNVVYSQIKNNLVHPEQQALIKAQSDWIEMRNKKFVQISKDDISLGTGMDNKMVKIQKKADFISERTTFLINQYITKKND